MSTNDYLQGTLPQMLEQSCKRFPERSAVYFKGQQWDYQTLGHLVKRFAAGLHSLGISEGDRVGIMLPNCPHYVAAYYGILQLGGIVVQINPMSVQAELEHYLSDSGAKALIVFAPFLPVVEKVKSVQELTARIVVELPATDNELPAGYLRYENVLALAEDVLEDLPATSTTPDDVAVLQYTGGTTGRSKGAMLTHRNLYANAYQCYAIMEGDLERPDRILTVIPLFHVYGMTVCMNMAIFGGSQQIIVPRFELDDVLQTIKETKPTIFPGVPTMYVAVNAHPRAEEYGISSIRLCASGSAPLPGEVIKEFEAKTKGMILEGFGLSEASPVTHFNQMDKRKVGSIGKTISFTESKIISLQDGETELGPNEAGELVVRGPQVMKGYWGMPEETAETLKDGWLYTGDIAYKDEEGYYYIIDRKKDLIIAGGFNIYPREVEEVLYQHPSVQEAVVIGVPDAYRGETVKAFVVLKKEASLTEAELQDYCREQMAAYKIPQQIEFREALPKTAVGKILRRRLREEEQGASAT
ncbi:long-chain fatty acid--CoA ligase [Brevibacillus ruminantium]|uniref:Long-chain fatty acid--CoA ligase n=1 Tax=Brevibacillus ruminantium TaxID=2950604 RepID=A0ABY4WIC3_9BACL|nr:long-chain fatty acid--CoA ligase [Brevibacillus ruminantium]USG66898.1 long-chain fatty acid--CoA ligase [Brevibacillus ruminantium]